METDIPASGRPRFFLIFRRYTRRDRVLCTIASFMLRLTSRPCRRELEATQLAVLAVPAELLR